MKRKTVSVIMLALLLIGLLTLTSKTQPTEAASRSVDLEDGNPVVRAFHDRQSIHRTSVLDDSITNVWLDGVHQRSYYIRPEEAADVHNATIVMETPYSEEYFPWINWDPSANHTVTPLDGNFSYEWAYHDPIPPFGQAAVWLDTVFPVAFKPDFDFQRTIDPVHITSQSINQTVTLEYTPHMDFFSTHIQVTSQNTSEANATIVPGSATPDWFWFETPSEVNWQFDPNMTTYVFSVEISVQNKLYPKPIFYKPSVWIGAFFDDSISVTPSTESVTVEDDLIEGSVTYSGKNLTGEPYDWQAITQNENSVEFPSLSALASGPIYIRADGSIEPLGAPISTVNNVTYTLTDNITSSSDGVIVERDNILIDGAGYTLQGTGSGHGIDLYGISNVSILSMEIQNFDIGVWVWQSLDSNITESNITRNRYGIAISSSSNSTFSNNILKNNQRGISQWGSSSFNNITANSMQANNQGFCFGGSHSNSIVGNNATNNEFGFLLWGSSSTIPSNNTFRFNRMINNTYNFGAYGQSLSDFIHDVDVSNTINGKPIHYLVNQQNLAINSSAFMNIGYLALINSTGIRVENLTLANNGQGLLLAYTTNSNITQNNMAKNHWGGIWLYNSLDNSISGNNVTANFVAGIRLDYSSNNTLINNDVSKHLYDPYSHGVYLRHSTNNRIDSNQIHNNSHSIRTEESSNNSISANNITESTEVGIRLEDSSNNNITENNISATNYDSIYLDWHSNYNIISNNNLTVMDFGIRIFASTFNIITGNRITQSDMGIYLHRSSHNGIFHNYVANNDDGFWFGWPESNNNTIHSNEIAYNNVGVNFHNTFQNSSDNRFYHNNFTNNTQQAYIHPSCPPSMWDNRYPSGGNYWSDYSGTDVYCGAYQNETGMDGVGDTPYIITGNNTDHYPLMKPYAGPHDIGIKASISKTIVAQGYNTTVTINTTIINYGEQTETFNFTFQINTTIKEQTLTLESRNSTTITTPWNTTGKAKGNYTITANTTILPGEIDTADNNLTDGWVFITIVGDVNGDRKVDLKDVFGVALAYGSFPGHPKWDPNLDINSDLKVDLKDYFAATLNYGESW